MGKDISSVINETFDRVILDSSERVFGFQKRNKNLKLLLTIFLVLATTVVFVFYSIFVKADIFSYYPSSCLGAWDNPQYAEGEPTLSPNTLSDKFSKNNSSFFDGGVKQIFCGGFKTDANASDKIFQKATLKFSWAVAIKLEQPVLEQSEFNQQIIDLPASASITVIPDSVPSSVSLETNTATPEQLSASISPSIIITPVPTVTPDHFPNQTASVSSPLSPNTLPTATPTGTPDVEPTVGGQPPTTPTESLTPTPTPIPAESPSSFNFLNKFFMWRGLEALASQSESIAPESLLTLRIADNSRHISASYSLDDFLEVLYTTDGQNWTPLARVNENNLNSLELELPIGSWDELKNLQISLRGLGTSDLEKQIYLDGMWIEVEYDKSANAEQMNSIELQERVNNSNTIKIDKTKVIKQPENKKDFRADEEPFFEINTDFPIPASGSVLPLPPGGILPSSSPSSFNIKNIFLSWFRKILKPESASAQQLTNQVSAEVFNLRGQKADIKTVVENINGKTTARLIKERAFKPGKYELRVVIVKSGEAYVTSQDFTWGVLAINTDKSIYLPGEKASLAMAVLNEFGAMICDAKVNLTVTNPAGVQTILSTANDGIKINPECRQKKVTLVPDYEAFFAGTNLTGTYAMKLKAETANGVWVINDSFEVRLAVNFEVQRLSATRIFPATNYPVTFNTKANRDWQGEMKEYVPASFEVSQISNGGRIISRADEKIIIWDVNMKKDGIYQFSYKYKAPDISPQFYLLGPLDIGAFKEIRKWQIAADASEKIILFQDPNDATPIGWTCISCISGDDYYQVFPVGSASYGGAGAVKGAANHTPTATVSVSGLSGTNNANAASSNTVSVSTHTHSSNTVTLNAVSNLPSYTNLKIIRYDTAGAPSTLPLNVIAMFDTGTLPNGFSAYTTADNTYIQGEGVSGTGGANSHSHTLTVALGTASGTVDKGNSTANALDSPTHTHPSTNVGNTDTQSNQPQHAGLILLKVTTDGATVPDGMIAMFDTTPGTSGWNVISGGSGALENDFLKASTSYNATGTPSANSHIHSATSKISSGADTIGSLKSGSGATGSAKGHTHTVSFSNFSTNDHRPPYKGIIIAKYTAPAVSLTLSLDGGGVIAFGTLTNGTRKTATTRLKAVQTGATSLTITAGRQRAISNVALASSAASAISANQISDTAGGIDVFNGLSNCSVAGSTTAVWVTGSSTGLGFSNWADSNSSKDTTCWGSGTTETDSNNKYAALEASAAASSFINIAASPPATLYTSIGYSLDVISTQKATTYDGGVVFTATVSP